MIPPISQRGGRYWAFVSYSWSDKPFAVALHRRLERFTIPRQMRKSLAAHWGMVPATRLRPIFRDDDELTPSGQLDERLRSAIDASTSMLLLTSIDAANSRYVNDEVAHFVGTRGLGRLIVIAVGGEINQPPVWPPALANHADGHVWIDCRGNRKLDRRGLIRLAAAILGVDYDTLWQRDRRRRRKFAGALAVAAIALSAAFSVLLVEQQASERLSPERQRLAFETFLRGELTSKTQNGVPDLAKAGVHYEILRGDDLNHDGLLDYVVYDNSPASCGSGGCSLLVYLTTEPGRYVQALELLGGSSPRLRNRQGESDEIVMTDFYASREPLYTVYELAGDTYKMSHFEFCDGTAFESCDPAVFEPTGGPSNPSVVPGAKIYERPSSRSRPATIGAGDSQTAESGWPPTVIGEGPDGSWFLVQIWKGSVGFVPASAIAD